MENQNNPKTKVVHTLSDDMTDVLGENQGGVVRQIIKEQEEREAYAERMSPGSEQNRVFVIMSALLLLFSLAGLLYIVFTRQASTVSVDKQFRPVIYVDRTGFVPTDGKKKQEILSSLTNALNSSAVRRGSVEGYFLTRGEHVLGFGEFADALLENLPGGALKYIDDEFLVGQLRMGDPEPFVLLGVRSFQDIFPIMRDWEQKMFLDFHDMFGIEVGPSTSYLINKDFEDGISSNKNARILYASDGSIALMYVFADEEHVVITQSHEATTEVIRRLSGAAVRK